MAARILLAAIAFTLGIHPVFAADAALIRAAEAEGHVTWYTVLLDEEAAKPMKDAFMHKYPAIIVDQVRTGSTQNTARILAEAKADQIKADVFDGAATVVTLRKADLVQPYIAQSARDVPAVYRDGDGYWTAQVLYFQTIGYNTDLVSPADAPRTLQDLLDPKWKGRLAWSGDGQLNGGLGFVVNVLMTMGERAGTEYLTKLKAQDLVKEPGGLPALLDGICDGRYAITLAALNHQVRMRKNAGKPVDWVMLNPTLGLSNNIGLVKGGPHPNAGKLLIDFILSEEGQSVLKAGNHVPSSSKVDALDPTLKTGFTVNYVRPDQMDAEIARAKAVMARIFP